MMILTAYRWHNTDPFPPRFFHGGNMTVSRQGFLELGGFDPRYGKAGAEDRGFSSQLGRRGTPAGLCAGGDRRPRPLSSQSALL